MAKKKEDVVKAREFRRNNARSGHPSYIVKVYQGKDKRSATFIGITSAAKTHGVKNIPLDKNPEPNKLDKSFVRPKVEEVELTRKTFGQKLKGWSFANSDKPKIKIIIEKSNKKTQHVGKPKR